jgi:hypothetical protein
VAHRPPRFEKVPPARAAGGVDKPAPSDASQVPVERKAQPLGVKQGRIRDGQRIRVDGTDGYVEMLP